MNDNQTGETLATYVIWGTCPECKKSVLVANGMLPHYTNDQPCPGEGQLPVSAPEEMR